MSIKKNEISTEKILEIIENINNKDRTMNSYEDELGIHRSSIKRRIKDHGYYFHSDTNRWLKGDINQMKLNQVNQSKEMAATKDLSKDDGKHSNILIDSAVRQIEALKDDSLHVDEKESSNEITEKASPTNKKEDVAPVGRPKKTGEYKRFNMEIPADLLKALKRKALEEDTTATEIIVKLLSDSIENKYR